jgi:hypothetical protein
MINTFFITQANFNDYLPITKNVNFNDIVPHLITTHAINLNEYLGTNFYKYLIDKFELQTLNGDEDVLVKEFIKPYTIWQTFYYLIPFITFQLTNKGILQFNSENSETIDLNELKFLLIEARDRSQWFAQRLVNYLCDNSKLFPQYRVNNNSDVLPFKGKTTYSTDLYLGNSFEIRELRKYFG